MPNTEQNYAQQMEDYQILCFNVDGSIQLQMRPVIEKQYS